MVEDRVKVYNLMPTFMFLLCFHGVDPFGPKLTRSYHNIVFFSEEKCEVQC